MSSVLRNLLSHPTSRNKRDWFSMKLRSARATDSPLPNTRHIIIDYPLMCSYELTFLVFLQDCPLCMQLKRIIKIRNTRVIPQQKDTIVLSVHTLFRLVASRSWLTRFVCCYTGYTKSRVAFCFIRCRS